MKTLVIGGTGPTGPYIVDGLLKRGHEVTVFHRGTHEVEFSGPVEHIHGDPHFPETLQQALDGRNFDLIVATYGRLRHVVEVAKGRTPRFIAVGGLPYRAFVEGEKEPDGVPVPIPETAPLYDNEAGNRFSYLMALSEQTVMEAHCQGHYSATLFRFPLVFGPRQLAPPEWSLIRRVLDGRKQLIIPDGGWRLERRGYAENMAHGVLLAVDKPRESAGQIYNVADETILPIRDWVTMIARGMKREWELVSMPFAFARPSRPYAGRAHNRVLDIAKVQKELGYRDVVPNGEAVRRTVEWYLAHRPAPGGEVERQLGDPFDYATEDRLIAEYRKATDHLRDIGEVKFKWRHAYDHPIKPVEKGAA
ncbi:MAG: NAD-dependent epimerase/dehydratase family protein [Chloroflexi bacterium]|nr:NAD-dependent epimerase/dehydratase family protein [Chloroflexota bacterium]